MFRLGLMTNSKYGVLSPRSNLLIVKDNSYITVTEMLDC